MQQQQNAGINSSITSSSSSSEHEQEVQYMMAEARLCSSRTCIEYRIQHRNVTMKNLEMEREIKSIRLKHGLLLGQVTTQGVAATARAAAMGEEAFRLPNGELMTAEKYTERTSILNQTRVALERSETKLRKMLEDNATLTKQKEYDSNEIRRCVLFLLLDLLFVSLIIIIIMLIVVYKKNSLEKLLSQFEGSRRFEIFSSEMHKETIEENSRHVDKIESLQKLLSESQEEILILKQKVQVRCGSSETRSSTSLRLQQQQQQQQPPVGTTTPPTTTSGIKSTSAFLCVTNGKVPGSCPLGGCIHYESVLSRGPDVMKNFQNHLNNTHRVGFLFDLPLQ